MGIQYNYSIFSSSQCLPIPPATLHVRKRWFGSPPERHMETKYTCEWLEKRRAKPMCFVSRNQKRPGRHFYCFLETKHAQNPGLFPMFPFSCVSTSTLAVLHCTAVLYCTVLYCTVLYCSVVMSPDGTIKVWRYRSVLICTTYL